MDQALAIAELELFDEVQSRRWPVYLVVDCSVTAAQTEDLLETLASFRDAVLASPRLAPVVHVGVIAFGSEAREILPLTAATVLQPPALASTHEFRSMSAACNLVAECIRRDGRVQFGSSRVGDFKPLAVLISTARANAEEQAALDELQPWVAGIRELTMDGSEVITANEVVRSMEWDTSFVADFRPRNDDDPILFHCRIGVRTRISCRPVPVRTDVGSLSYESIDGKYLVQLRPSFEPWYSRVVAFMQTSGLAIDPFWRSLLSPPVGIATSVDFYYDDLPEICFGIVSEQSANPDLRALDWYLSRAAHARLPGSQRATWEDRLALGAKIACGVERLHSSGIVHGNLSGQTVLVDPRQKEVKLTGWGDPAIGGTSHFMAPELHAGTSRLKELGVERSIPDTRTDLHSLAVLLYELLLMRHPLEGSQVHAHDADEQMRLMFGERALFIEHPTDHANRPQSLRVTLDALGPELRHLFFQAFVDGLHDPERRPSASQWVDALDSATHRLIRCANTACDMQYYPWPISAPPNCPWCGAIHARVATPLLPVYLVIDRSGAATQPGAIAELYRNLLELKMLLENDYRTTHDVRLALITFGDDDATVQVPLRDIAQFQPSPLAAAARSPLGKGFSLLLGELDREVQNFPMFDSHGRVALQKSLIVVLMQGDAHDDWLPSATRLGERARAGLLDVIVLGLDLFEDRVGQSMLARHASVGHSVVFGGLGGVKDRYRLLFRLIASLIDERVRFPVLRTPPLPPPLPADFRIII